MNKDITMIKYGLIDAVFPIDEDDTGDDTSDNTLDEYIDKNSDGFNGTCWSTCLLMFCTSWWIKYNNIQIYSNPLTVIRANGHFDHVAIFSDLDDEYTLAHLIGGFYEEPITKHSIEGCRITHMTGTNTLVWNLNSMVYLGEDQDSDAKVPERLHFIKYFDKCYFGYDSLKRSYSGIASVSENHLKILSRANKEIILIRMRVDLAHPYRDSIIKCLQADKQICDDMGIKATIHGLKTTGDLVSLN